ncbi:propionyl-CoA synthetase [Candidatus Electrothrix communis]|uniref:Propionyl-CoA synthetase n=1 Tax=Candidatus Electrothrix communis TaxID=1859133 RepID=A0A3S3RCH5_9BACT|nr:propionyl-CoA synthetase [Candidatus Electrothrix communis]
MEKYQEVFDKSLNNPEDFWAEAAESISWYKKWDVVLDSSDPPFYRWFRGGELNTCYNAVDRHVENGHGDRTAIIYDSPVTDTVRKMSWAELRDQVAQLAGALKQQGAEKGDTIIVYMPMIPEALVAMLACARLGVIHSVVFGGFAADELAIRIDHAQPKMILCASGAIEGKKKLAYKPLVEAAIEQSEHKPEKTIVFQRDFLQADLGQPGDLNWQELVKDAEPADCVPVAATDPLYILYTSGTTGMPKGVLRDNGGHAVALHWSMKNIYNMEPGDVYWAASDVGWVVGHSYIVYGPLLYGCTTVVYEGKPVGTPDAGAFWRVIAEHKVKALFTAPTAFRAIKKEDPEGLHLKKYDLSEYKTLFLAGERLDPDTYHWAKELLGVPVIDHWWQTETAWAIVANPMGIEQFPVKPGSATKSVVGYDVKILDSEGNELEPGEEGNIVIKLPLPPGTLATLWRNKERFISSYMSRYPGYYETGDGGYIDKDGYVFVMGRIDDVINIAGHRLSTGAMEEIVASHSQVAECSVIGIEDSLKGQKPLGLVVLKAGADCEVDKLNKELSLMVRNSIGPIACYRETVIVARLPKTRSGKILRGTMRAIAAGKEYRMPSTIDDPSCLEEIAMALKIIGYPVEQS